MATIKERVLINEEYLKEYSPLPKNYNISEVKNYIKVAELIWIKSILGENLYDELLDEVENNVISDENSTLLLNIYPVLGFAVVYESLPFIWSHISEVGITLGHSDNSETINLKDLDYILNHLRAQLQARADNLKDFLDTHSDSFPLYEKKNCCCNLKKLNPFQQIYTNKKKNKEIK